MVGTRKRCTPMAPTVSQDHTLNRRRTAHRRRVDGSRARRILAVRRRLLDGNACGDALTGLLSATQAEMPRRRQPIGQDREGLAAGMTDATSHPDPVVAMVVRLLAPLAVADDGIIAAKRTPPRKQFQREDGLVLRLWQCDKKNHGWREGRPLTVAAKFRSEDRPSPSR